MRSYAQYCPVAKASEILGDRWTLLIVREMLGGASGFNELQRGLPGISRSVLTDRMRALERAEVIERRTGPKGRTLEYRLSPAGRDLQPVVQAIGEWGATWSFTDPRPRGTRSRPVDRLDGSPRRSPAAPTQPNRGSVRLSRPQAALLDSPRARRGISLPPASRFRRRPRGHRRRHHALPRLLGTDRAGRRDSSRPADDDRPANAATWIRPLVHLERIRPSQRLGAEAPHSRLTPFQPSSRTTRSSGGLKSRPPSRMKIADPLENTRTLREEGLSVVVTNTSGGPIRLSRYHRTGIRETSRHPNYGSDAPALTRTDTDVGCRQQCCFAWKSGPLAGYSPGDVAPINPRCSRPSRPSLTPWTNLFCCGGDWFAFPGDQPIIGHAEEGRRCRGSPSPGRRSRPGIGPGRGRGLRRSRR